MQGACSRSPHPRGRRSVLWSVACARADLGTGQKPGAVTAAPARPVGTAHAEGGRAPGGCCCSELLAGVTCGPRGCLSTAAVPSRGPWSLREPSLRVRERVLRDGVLCCLFSSLLSSSFSLLLFFPSLGLSHFPPDPIGMKRKRGKNQTQSQ